MDDRPLDGVEHVQSAPVIALLGPTAVGKSRHALELCEEFDGVIVSADSRQIYRYMDIGTAKPSPAERASGATLYARRYRTFGDIFGPAICKRSGKDPEGHVSAQNAGVRGWWHRVLRLRLVG